MIRCRSHKPGISLLEVVIALAMIAIVITALLSSQGRAFDAGMRAIFEQQVTLALRQEFTRMDVQNDPQRKPFTKPLPEHCPSGSMTFTASKPPEASPLSAYQHLMIELLTATWNMGRREYTTRLVRYCYRIPPDTSSSSAPQSTNQQKERA
jgi:Tfp pilus assembly protein PilV